MENVGDGHEGLRGDNRRKSERVKRERKSHGEGAESIGAVSKPNDGVASPAPH